ncbi:MAG: Fic family protein [Candidatus Levybacteria bacterium]|nr:Fic family protein [Candidatus Levybacteria bacterium]
MYTPIFTIINSILKNIGIIEAAKEVIDHAPLLPYYEKQFQKDAMIRTVHYGTHIEGNELSLNQAEKVIQGQDVVARQRDVQEVINYRKAMEYIEKLKIKNEKLKINEDFIKELHKIIIARILDPQKSGVYRSSQVVVKSSATGEVTFKPPPATTVQFHMGDFVQFINDNSSESVHPVLKSGIVHYEFVRIHPFVDGNGRVGRALSILILFQEGYDIRRFFSLEEYFDSDARRYYEALRSVERNKGDLTEWLAYFTEGLAIELAKIKEKVERISIDGKLREKLGGKPILLSDRQLAIIEYIQKTGYLQNSGFKQLFPMVSEDTVLNELKALIQSGIVKKHGSTKAAKYVMI